DAQARLADPPDLLDHRLALEVLQLDGEVHLAAVLRGRVVRNVALVLQHAGDRDLGARRRHADADLAGFLAVTDTGQHVGYGIGHAHRWCPVSLRLPARFREPRDLAAHRGFPKLVARQAELAVVAVRPPGDRAAV